MICEGYKKLACWSIAIAGFTALLVLVYQDTIKPVAASVGLLSAGLALLTVRSRSYAIATAIGALASFIIAVIADPVAGMILALVAGVPVALSGSVGGALLTGLAYAIAEISGHPAASGLAALTIASSGLAAYAYTRRLHSITLSLALILPLLFPGYAHILAASALAVLLGTGRIVEASGCPFRVENRLVLAGLGIAGMGILLMTVLGPSIWLLAYWLLGFNMLIAGALVPVTPSS